MASSPSKDSSNTRIVEVRVRILEGGQDFLRVESLPSQPSDTEASPTEARSTKVAPLAAKPRSFVRGDVRWLSRGSSGWEDAEAKHAERLEPWVWVEICGGGDA